MFGEGEANETLLINEDNPQLYWEGKYFIARYESDGAFGSVREYDIWPVKMIALPDLSLMVIGMGYGCVTFDKGGPNETEIVHDGGILYMAKYDENGEFLKAKAAYASVEYFCIDTDALPDGSYYVGGLLLSNSSVFGPGEPAETILDNSGMFLAKYDPDMNLEWARRDTAVCMKVAALPEGSAAALGFHGYDYGPEYDYDAIFGEGEKNATIIPKCGQSCSFIAKYGP
jgi:hypothetical protein